jgi:hypothetical protein
MNPDISMLRMPLDVTQTGVEKQLPLAIESACMLTIALNPKWTAFSSCSQRLHSARMHYL